ncbi:MAG: nucleotide sugar dehydrogenase [Pseudomonadota bacterium]
MFSKTKVLAGFSIHIDEPFIVMHIAVMTPQNINYDKIAVIGLGYVGMPLALALATHYNVTGFDVDSERVNELKEGFDRNREIRQGELRASSCLFTSELQDIADSNVYIVTVPTPVDEENNKPDLSIVEAASKSIAGILKKDDIVVYESTVYPGVTEDICGALLEKESGLKCGTDFYLGYSPERINPGDTKHTVKTITKVVAGQTPEITDILADIYAKTNDGNIFKAANIKTAEASKAIENAQRDINVAFVNEVTKIVNELDLSVYDVLDAAATKWNFLKFTPGLVGGHCIGVDPYYLAQCARDLGHDPEVILAGRHTNDTMGAYFANRLMRKMGEGKKDVLILGFTFKENINDIRNTKVIDVYKTLADAGHNVIVHDPHANPEEVETHYNVELSANMPVGQTFDAVILAVSHKSYQQMGEAAIKGLLKPNGLLYDLKGLWRSHNFDPSIQYLTV